MITTELFRADVKVTAGLLNELLTKIWEKDEIPEDWSKGLK